MIFLRRARPSGMIPIRARMHETLWGDMSEQDAVLAANATFYRVLREGDYGAMQALWSDRRHVTCTHPSGQPLEGRRAVMESWRLILTEGEAPPIRHCDAQAVVTGHTAIVLCRERVGDATLMAANAFALENGVWRMINHQASPVPGTVR